MTPHTRGDTLLEDTLTRCFTERSGPEARQQAEHDGWVPDLWDALTSTGLVTVGIPEADGGSGGSLLDAAMLLRLAGRHAVPLPLAESGALLGGWLVTRAGLPLPDGPLSVAVPHATDDLTLVGTQVTGALARVPWSSHVRAVVGLARSDAGPHVVLLDPAEGAATPGRTLAGEPRDRLVFEDVALDRSHIAPAPPDLVDELALRGALTRTLLMAGALETVSDMTVAYAEERHQFGRPVSRFQAVAQRLARLAAETELAALAADVAIRRFETARADAAFEVASAKTTVSRAATEVAAHAHQVHGAIGMSQEYPLHHFTRRLWVWRQEWGSGTHWSRQSGARLAAAGARALWPRVASSLDA